MLRPSTLDPFQAVGQTYISQNTPGCPESWPEAGAEAPRNMVDSEIPGVIRLTSPVFGIYDEHRPRQEHELR